jgi:hypothetical protein
VADYVELPDNVEIIATIIQNYDTVETTVPATLNADKTAVEIDWRNGK